MYKLLSKNLIRYNRSSYRFLSTSIPSTLPVGYTPQALNNLVEKLGGKEKLQNLTIKDTVNLFNEKENEDILSNFIKENSSTANIMIINSWNDSFLDTINNLTSNTSSNSSSSFYLNFLSTPSKNQEELKNLKDRLKFMSEMKEVSLVINSINDESKRLSELIPSLHSLECFSDLFLAVKSNSNCNIIINNNEKIKFLSYLLNNPSIFKLILNSDDDHSSTTNSSSLPLIEDQLALSQLSSKCIENDEEFNNILTSLKKICEEEDNKPTSWLTQSNIIFIKYSIEKILSNIILNNDQNYDLFDKILSNLNNIKNNSNINSLSNDNFLTTFDSFIEILINFYINLNNKNNSLNFWKKINKDFEAKYEYNFLINKEKNKKNEEFLISYLNFLSNYSTLLHHYNENNDCFQVLKKILSLSNEYDLHYYKSISLMNHGIYLLNNEEPSKLYEGVKILEELIQDLTKIVEVQNDEKKKMLNYMYNKIYFNSIINLSSYYSYTNPNKAKDLSIKALKLLKSKNNFDTLSSDSPYLTYIIDLSNLLGSLYLNDNQLEEALEHFQFIFNTQSTKLSKEFSYVESTQFATACHYLSTIYQEKNNFKDACECLFTGLKVIQENNIVDFPLLVDMSKNLFDISLQYLPQEFERYSEIIQLNYNNFKLLPLSSNIKEDMSRMFYAHLAFLSCKSSYLLQDYDHAKLSLKDSILAFSPSYNNKKKFKLSSEAENCAKFLIENPLEIHMEILKDMINISDALQMYKVNLSLFSAFYNYELNNLKKKSKGNNSEEIKIILQLLQDPTSKVQKINKTLSEDLIQFLELTKKYAKNLSHVDGENAIKYYTALINISKNILHDKLFNKQSDFYYDTQLELANFIRDSADSSHATTLYNTLLEEIKDQYGTNHDKYLNVLIDLAGLYHLHSDPEKAIASLKEIIRQYSQLPSQSETIVSSSLSSEEKELVSSPILDDLPSIEMIATYPNALKAVSLLSSILISQSDMETSKKLITKLACVEGYDISELENEYESISKWDEMMRDDSIDIESEIEKEQKMNGDEFEEDFDDDHEEFEESIQIDDEDINTEDILSEKEKHYSNENISFDEIERKIMSHPIKTTSSNNTTKKNPSPSSSSSKKKSSSKNKKNKRKK